MKTLALAVTLLAVPPFALAAEEQAAAQNPMEGWAPRKVMHEQKDKKEIQALWKAMDEAGKKGDLEAAAALVDFPVLMVTDTSKGEAKTESWSREKWMEVMAPFYKQPMTDMKVTHRPSIFMVTDSLATVNNQCTIEMGKQKRNVRNATLVVRKDGKWLVKSMTEGGWGDMMEKGAAHAQGAGTSGEASAPTGTGAHQTEQQGTGQGESTTK